MYNHGSRWRRGSSAARHLSRRPQGEPAATREAYLRSRKAWYARAHIAMRFHRNHPLLPTSRLPFGVGRRPFEHDGGTLRAGQGSSPRRRYAEPQPLCVCCPDALSFLHEVLEVLAPNALVEFGSGESTLVLSEWSTAQGASLTSVEHDIEWIRRLETRLAPDMRKPVSLRPCATFAPTPARRRLPDLQNSRCPARSHLGSRIHFFGRPSRFRPRASPLQHPKQLQGRCHNRPGDFNQYFVRDMLGAIRTDLASSFVAVAVEDNSRGLFILRCVKAPPRIDPRARPQSHRAKLLANAQRLPQALSRRSSTRSQSATRRQVQRRAILAGGSA